MVGGLVVPLAFLMAFGLPEKYAAYLVLVGMVPFEYVTYCVLRSRQAPVTTKYEVAAAPAISAELFVFLSDSMAANWAERMEIQRTQSEELQKRLIELLAPTRTTTQSATAPPPISTPDKPGAPYAAVSSASW